MEKIFKLNFRCCYVQIRLIMSQQTLTDIFHKKMLLNVLWCQITWKKCMLCNILKYFSQALDIHGQRVLQLILFLFMTLKLLGICDWMRFCSRRVYNIENIVDIKDLKKKSSCASLSTSNIEYGDIIIGLFFFQSYNFFLINFGSFN